MKIFKISLGNSSSSVVLAETKEDAIKMFSDGYKGLYDRSPKIQCVDEIDMSKARIVAFNH